MYHSVCEGWVTATVWISAVEIRSEDQIDGKRAAVLSYTQTGSDTRASRLDVYFSFRVYHLQVSVRPEPYFGQMHRPCASIYAPGRSRITLALRPKQDWRYNLDDYLDIRRLL